MNLRLLLLLLLLAFAGSGCVATITSSEVGPADPLTEPLIEEEEVEPEAEIPTPAPSPMAAPVTTFCPQVGRPALFLFVPDAPYQLFDPATGESCEVDVLHSEALLPHFGGDDLFYLLRSQQGLGVHRVQPGGAPQALPSVTTMIPEGAYADLNYVVSADGSTIAWAVTAPGEADQTTSELLVAPVSTETDAPVTTLAARSQPEPRTLQPVRFSADGSVLYYTLSPMGIGGSWIAFTGRYDNLYAVPTTGGEPTKIFDCAELALNLCLGDFQVHENEVLALAYTDSGDGAVILLNGAGVELNRFTPGGAYVGYPTISPAGEIIFYSAELGAESLLPATATIHRVAPPTAPAEALASNSQLVLPQRFLDDGTLVVGYAHDEMSWGVALVDMMGEMSVVDPYQNATLLEVVP